jgi:hypothetical protein
VLGLTLGAWDFFPASFSYQWLLDKFPIPGQTSATTREQPREHGNPDEGVRPMSRPEDVSWQTAVAIAIIVAASLALLLFMVRPGP